MCSEYRAIVDAGFLLQIDNPGLGETWDMLLPAPPLEDYRRMQARNIEALNHALAGIPEERVRDHLCWGSWQGPQVHDLGLRDIVDLLLRVKAQAYSVEAATPRHAYEWRVWEGPLFAAICHDGLRVDEATALTVDDLDLKHHRLFFHL